MKILWIVNIILPEIAKTIGISYSNREGWLSGIFNKVSENPGEYELAVAFPISKEKDYEVLSVKGIRCYPFHEDLNSPYIYDDSVEIDLKNIISDFEPDILHIFGTEFPHALAGARAFGNPSKTLVGIQGICTVIAKDYMAGIPKKVQEGATFRDIIRHDSVKDQQNKFFERSKNEKELLIISNAVTGRTMFDKEFTEDVNPERIYYPMHETMRSSFYEGKWDINKIIPGRVFIGQGDYPIKGMHFLVEAVGMLKERCPELEIVVAGNSIIDCNSLKSRLKLPKYGQYLRQLIKKHNLSDSVKVLGPLTEEQMKEEYLKANLYVLPSYVENSPNTVAEAMLLGMPVVASDACGIPSVISENEGFLFRRGDSTNLAERIEEVINLSKKHSKLLLDKCEKAYARAADDYSPVNNSQRLFEIYDSISQNK